MIRNDSATSPKRILVVDDESFVREAIELYLLTEGFEVSSAGSGHDALRLLEEQEVDLAILDVMMPGMSGLELLGEIKSRHPDTEVVMASGCGTLETAVEAMRMGAYDYVPKPILNFQDDLLKVILKALERRRLLALNRRLSADVQVVNRELKESNSTLKRQLAEFDVLYDSSRMLSEIGQRDEMLAFAKQILQYQLGVSAAILLTRRGDEYHASLNIGFEPTQGGDDAPHLPADEVERWLVRESEAGTLSPDAMGDLAKALGWRTDVVPSGWTRAPLRSAGNWIGILIVDRNPATNPKLLELFTHQLAAPLALAGTEVTR